MSNYKTFRLGKKPFYPYHKDLLLEKYFSRKEIKKILASIPPQFGHEDLVTQLGDCLGNDIACNCVIVAIYRMIMAWNKARGVTIKVSKETALKTYSKITGYDPNNPDSDQGTNERDALTYALNVGFEDDDGNVHKIGGFAHINPKNFDLLDAATYLFESILLGIEITDKAMEQFEAGQPWDVIPHESVEGGHGVPDIAKRVNRICMTWGALQQITKKYLLKFLDEAWAVWSPEMFINGKTLEGIDQQQLLADQRAVQS